MFPFQWTINGLENECFSKQISFNNILFDDNSNWLRVFNVSGDERASVYNEKCYFYEFVHDALYDTGINNNNNLVRHYERKELKQGTASYIIEVKDKTYNLNLQYMNLNLYSTGVGVLSFYLQNDKYFDFNDILNINQFGRRVYPSFWDDSKFKILVANKLEIKGLNGVYCENFENCDVNHPNAVSNMVTKLILEEATNVTISPVVDDRMFVMSWYRNDNMSNKLKKEYESFIMSDDWYKYVFVDNGDITCQNLNMQRDLINDSTYNRWQKKGTLYAVTRYSCVMLTNSECPDYLMKYFETEYVRMAELVLVQKASVLRFSSEVTRLSALENPKSLADKVNSLYKEYIRFVNQIYFREVSAQDQGIEMYNKFMKFLCVESQVQKLDGEIEELYNYVSLCEDRHSNKNMYIFTMLATIFVPMTIVTGFFGMNNVISMGDQASESLYVQFWFQCAILIVLTFLFVAFIYVSIKRRGKR